ncbi:unnamed protein product [Rotaria sp. Silwood2]|nr:unnamed protein product [Rotaria sp. Silwood2]
MSSVPLQFLFYGYAVLNGCSTPPSITGDRPNRVSRPTRNDTYIHFKDATAIFSLCHCICINWCFSE